VAPARVSLIARDAGPLQTRAKGSDKTVLAHRLADEQPEAKQNGDQRHAEQQPRIHFKAHALRTGRRQQRRPRRIAIASMAAARRIDLIEADDDFRRNQQHDDDFEAKRAARIGVRNP